MAQDCILEQQIPQNFQVPPNPQVLPCPEPSTCLRTPRDCAGITQPAPTTCLWPSISYSAAYNFSWGKPCIIIKVISCLFLPYFNHTMNKGDVFTGHPGTKHRDGQTKGGEEENRGAAKEDGREKQTS